MREAPASIRDILLGSALAVVEDLWGFDFPDYRLGDFVRQAEQVRHEAGYASLEDFLADLGARRLPAVVSEQLLESLVVGESYFLRHREQLEAIAGRVLPVLLATADRPVRVWSAGCARGEEPYSLAILTNYYGVRPEALEILGTDLSEQHLAQAREGRFRSFSLRGVPAEVVNMHFRRDGEGYFIDSRIRNRVRFARHNLATEINPFGHNPVDVIVCRNVLIYMSRERVEKVLRFLISCLAPGGYLVLGASENILGIDLPLEPLPLDVHGIYRRADGPELPDRLPAVPRRPTKSAPRGGAMPTRATRPKSEPSPGQADMLGSAIKRAGALLQSGDLKQADQLGPSAGNFEADLAVAGILLREGSEDDLKACLQRMIAKNPRHVAGYYFSALVAIKDSDPERALNWLRRALYLDPDFVVGHIQSAMILGQLKRHRESELALKNADRLLRSRRPDEPVPFADGRSADELRRLIGEE